MWRDDPDCPTNSSRASKIASEAQSPPRGRFQTGVKLLGCMGLSALAFGFNTVGPLAALSVVNLLLLLLPRVRSRSLWQGTKAFVWQTAIVVVLYVLRFGLADGLWPGFKISWQLFLAFLPAVTFVQTTPQPRLLQTLAGVMPYRMAFVMGTCLRFIPLVIGEIRSIQECQVLRGAKILPQDLLRPWNWPDLIHCLVAPVIIQSMNLAGEIALAAKARGFGVKSSRTYWPGR